MSKINKVGVIGAGTMGSGIASHVANAGVPVVLLEGEEGHYWDDWLQWVKQHLGDNGWISQEDLSLLQYIVRMLN